MPLMFKKADQLASSWNQLNTGSNDLPGLSQPFLQKHAKQLLPYMERMDNVCYGEADKPIMLIANCKS